jgi:hypothetical protein
MYGEYQRSSKSDLAQLTAHAQKKCLGVVADFLESALDKEHGDNEDILSSTDRTTWCDHFQQALLSSSYDSDLSVYEQATHGLVLLQKNTLTKCSLRKGVLNKWVSNQIATVDSHIWEEYASNLGILQSLL